MWILVVYLMGLPFGYAGISRLLNEGPVQSFDRKFLLSFSSLLWPLAVLIGTIVLISWLFSQVVTPFEKLVWRLWPKKVDKDAQN